MTQPTAQGRAWAEHITRIWINAKHTHDHHHGTVLCTTCMNPSDHRHCGEPTCPICATP